MARNLSNTAASLLPYSTIEAAASGNVDAINAVLKQYERYIAALATRTLYDENGVPHLCLDEEKVCSCLLYTSPSPRDGKLSRMPSSA